jgi:hypothetical protein
VNFRSIGRIFTTTLTIRHGINVRHLPLGAPEYGLLSTPQQNGTCEMHRPTLR